MQLMRFVTQFKHFAKAIFTFDIS